jgi:hypothetical protein
MKKKNRLIWIIACVASLVVLCLVGCPYYMRLGQDGWCTIVYEVDINSARIRTTHYILRHQIAQRCDDTQITKELSQIGVRSSSGRWAAVYMFPMGMRVSPSFTYHSAILSIRALENHWSSTNTPKHMRKQQALSLISRWQSQHGDF